MNLLTDDKLIEEEFMIFDEKERTRSDPKKQGEEDFEFYDSIAGTAYDTYRALLNGWISDYPKADRKDLIGRFRKGGSLSYRAALAELIIYAALKKQGYLVEVHPACGHPSRKPDFLAKDARGSVIDFIEVTTFGPSLDLIARSKRDAAVYNGIDKVQLPAGCRLGINIIKHGNMTPSLRKLRASIEKWAGKQGEIETGMAPTQIFAIDDWEIELVLFGGFPKDVMADSAIVSAMGELRQVTAAEEIREAIYTKGSAYDPLDAPYLIVVADCKDELVGGDRNGEALLEAVLGTIYTEVRTVGSGPPVVVDKRRPNGYWGTLEAPAHSQVSGVILLPKPHLWDLRNERWQPRLVKNGRADRPLPNGFVQLPGFAVGKEGDVAKVEGTLLADLVGLPAKWPPD